jgi:dTDP-4-dehydrorhamnose 3,5-epimerase
MKVTPLDLAGLLLIELKVFGDSRGFFIERFNRAEFEKHGVPVDFVQDNHSRSAPGVLRGLHFQKNPDQGKLVGVSRGRVWDVVVDIRPNSPTYGKHLGLELSDLNGKLLWIPGGSFAHGFCVLGEEPVDMLYKVDQFYNPAHEVGIHWADPDLGIQWPIADPLVSARDRALPSFATYKSSQRSPG